MTPLLLVEAFLSGFLGSLSASYTQWHLRRTLDRLCRWPPCSDKAGGTVFGAPRQRIWHLWL